MDLSASSTSGKTEGKWMCAMEPTGHGFRGEVEVEVEVQVRARCHPTHWWRFEPLACMMAGLEEFGKRHNGRNGIHGTINAYTILAGLAGCSQGTLTLSNRPFPQDYGRIYLSFQAKVYGTGDASARHGVELHMIEYIVSKNSITKENATKQTQVWGEGAEGLSVV